jgi:hypothetical protein
MHPCDEALRVDADRLGDTMLQRAQRHLSFANVTSLMALVFAMGGTGYALTLPKASVGSKQIRKTR